jgi:hypothetical protein
LTTLRDRAINKLRGNSLTFADLVASLRLTSTQGGRDLRPLLIAMQNEGAIAIVDNKYTAAGAAPAPPKCEPAPADEPTEARRAHRVTTDMKRRAADQKARIIQLLEVHGSLTAPHVLELLADPTLTMKDVQNRLTYMRLAGVVEATGHGYALTNYKRGSNDVDGAPPADPHDGEATASASTAPADDLPDGIAARTWGGVGLNARAPNRVTTDTEVVATGDESSEPLQPIRFATRDELVEFRRDELRNELLEIARALRNGECSADQGKVALDALQYVAAIDQGEPA